MWDKSAQFIAAAGVNLLKSNNSLADPVFENPFVKRLLSPDNSGLYDVDALFAALDETFRQYREFPVPLPTIPFLSRNENSFTFRAEDLEEIKRRISAACGYGM